MTPNHMMRVQTQGILMRKKGKKRGNISRRKTKIDAIPTSGRVYLRQKALRETHNYGLCGGEDSGTGGTSGKETNQRRRVVEGGGKDRRQAFACVVKILYDDRRMLIGGIKVECYGKITRADLAREFILNGIIKEITHEVDKIRGNYDTLAATLSLTE